MITASIKKQGMDAMKSECDHKWEKRRVCPEDCNIPLAGGVEDLTGGFCYGKDPNECNFFVYGWRCSICGAKPDFEMEREE